MTAAFSKVTALPIFSSGMTFEETMRMRRGVRTPMRVFRRRHGGCSGLCGPADAVADAVDSGALLDFDVDEFVRVLSLQRRWPDGFQRAQVVQFQTLGSGLPSRRDTEFGRISLPVKR